LLKLYSPDSAAVREFIYEAFQKVPKYQRTKNVLTKQFDFLKLTMGGIENEFD